MSWLDRILSWFKPRPRPGPVPVNPGTTAAVITALNAERAKVGMRPLAESAKLDASALGWARSEAAAGVLSHGNLSGRMAIVVPGRVAGEDIAVGQATVARVVATW